MIPISQPQLLDKYRTKQESFQNTLKIFYKNENTQ